MKYFQKVLLIHIFQNFSEKGCIGLLEVMKHCGWHSITNTAREVKQELPPFPNHLQLKFRGCRCLGDFGDGFVLYIAWNKIMDRHNLSTVYVFVFLFQLHKYPATLLKNT